MAREVLLRLFTFVVIYTILGILIPIQGSVTIGFIIGTIITAFLYGLTLYYMHTNIPLGKKARILIAWMAIYVIQMLNPVLEGYFFSTQFEDQPELVFSAVLFGLILTLPTALASGFLFSPSIAIRSFIEMRQEYFEKIKSTDFIIRFIIASVLWMVIYFIFGNIVAPFVMPYYTNGGVGYNLVLPAIEIIILLQTFRGFIYVVSVLPIIISFDLDWKQLAIVLVSLLYVGGALAIFIISEQFPVFLRLIHGIELFADSFFAGIAIAYILGKQAATRIE